MFNFIFGGLNCTEVLIVPRFVFNQQERMNGDLILHLDPRYA